MMGGFFFFCIFVSPCRASHPLCQSKFLLAESSASHVGSRSLVLLCISLQDVINQSVVSLVQTIRLVLVNDNVRDGPGKVHGLLLQSVGAIQLRAPGPPTSV